MPSATEDRVQAAYLAACEQQAASDLAKANFLHRPNNFTLLECRLVAAQLPDRDAVCLDIGTGMGILPRTVKQLGARAITVDIPSDVETAVADVRRDGVEGHFADITKDRLPLDTDSVDCVFMGDVIEHLPHSPKPALREILRVLRPGGAVVVSTPNAVRLSVRLKVLLGASNWPHVRDYFDKDYHGGHHHEYTAEELRYVLSKAGYELASLTIVNSDRYRQGVARLSEAQSQNRRHDERQQRSLAARAAGPVLLGLSSLHANLRDQMLAVARKPEASQP